MTRGRLERTSKEANCNAIISGFLNRDMLLQRLRWIVLVADVEVDISSPTVGHDVQIARSHRHLNIEN